MTAWRTLGVRWLLGAACATLAQAPLQAQVVAPSLASIPVDAPASAAAPQAGEALHVRVHVADAAGLARLLGEPAPDPASGAPGASGSLALRLRAGEHADAGGPADARAASFIVDHDDAAVRQLAESLQAGRVQAGAGAGSAPGGAEIVAFVARRMRTSYEANASLASEVARSLQGDCTEFALLTAALARALGLPARMVQGVAIVHAEGRWQAYGHAWAQTLEAGHWTVRDSALANFPGPVYYMPFAAMDDEGPGFRLALMMRAQGHLPRRIEVLGLEAPR